MKLPKNIRLIAFLCAIPGLSGYALAYPMTPDIPAAASPKSTEPALSPALTQLRHTFNADAADVRLLFIVNAACRTCMTRLDHLHDALSNQKADSRLRIFVVYTSNSSTRTKPRVSTAMTRSEQAHGYWDPDAMLAQRYRESLGIGLNKQAMWMIYGRGQRWTGRLPPNPDFWMHQLQNAPGVNDSNRAEFSRRVALYLAKLKGTVPDSQGRNESGSHTR